MSDDIFNSFLDFEKCTDVEPHLYWSGRMSIAVDMVKRASALNFSSSINLLIKCKEKYDEKIFEMDKKVDTNK